MQPRRFAQLTGQPNFEIFLPSEIEVFWELVAAPLTFMKDEKRNVANAIHEQAGRKFGAPATN